LLTRIWDRLAAMSNPRRRFAKLGILALVVFFVLFPNPYRLVLEIMHLCNVESLIQPSMPAMTEINAELDKLTPPDATRQQQFKIIEKFVYQKIKYQYDWYLWGNLDYWPTATECWDRKSEDCDGRAILAATILRARGFKEARIVANLNHVWVAVGPDELMGPQAEKNIQKVNGKTVVTLPGWQTLLDTVALSSKFPILRHLIIYFTLLLLCLHPRRDVTGFFFSATVGLVGFALVFEYAAIRLDREVNGINASLVVGGLLLFGSLGLAALMGRFRDRRESR
jgi:hypothetical protein